MFVYPDHEKLDVLSRLGEIAEYLGHRPDEERNERAYQKLSELVCELMPTVAKADSDAVEAEIRQELARSGIIPAIKLARSRMGCGLGEARDYVERLRSKAA